MIIKRLWLVLLALVLLTGCAGSPGGINALSPTPNPEEAVARITYANGNAELVSQNELEAYAERLGQLNPQQGPPPPAIALEFLLQRKLMLYLARTTDTLADSGEIDRLVTNITQPNGFCSQVASGDPANQRAFLDECAQALGFENGLEFRNFIAEELTITKVAQQEAPKDMIRAAHILTDDYEQAAAAYDQAQRAPGRFAEVAREFSVDPGSRDQGGELPPFDEQGSLETQPGQQPQQFDTTFVSNTWELRDEFEQTGEAITEPFQTDFGWHIVKILELEASQNSVNQFQNAVLERALTAQPGQTDTGEDDVPLLGTIEILREFPTPEPIPTPEIPLPEVSPSPGETETPLLPEEGAAPEETTTPDETAAPEGGAPAETSPEASPETSPEASPTQ